MLLNSGIATAAGTICCALGIGFVMQNGEVADLRYGSFASPTVTSASLIGQPVAPRKSEPDLAAPLAVDAITLTSAQLSHQIVGFDANMLIKAALDVDVFDAPGLSSDRLAVDPQKAPHCPMEAEASPQAAAMIAFSLNAPCHAGSAVTVRHGDLAFSTVLSDSGTLTKEIPALAADARIDVLFATGETVEAYAEVDSLPLYDRVVVQWRGAMGVQIHAREFGARYGEEGHVWIGANRDLSALAEGYGGHLTSLGDPALVGAQLAEIYTFPSAMTPISGAVDLTIETEVTAANCEQDVLAHTLRLAAGRKMSSREMTLSMPTCDAIGSYLVLNNLLEDLTVATR